MADVNYGFIANTKKKLVDMGDGTHAERVSVVAAEDGVTLTKSSVTMSGSSATLVSADATRKIVLVSNTDSNAVAAIDPTGGTCALDAGIPILPGETKKITGKAAQSAMTQIGTNTQKLTVYTG